MIKELDGATRDLDAAKLSLKTGDHKWATIQAYYSIFHAARALLYRMGFRERSHRGLLAALRELYDSSAVNKMLGDFSEAMTLREEADYGLTSSEESATNCPRRRDGLPRGGRQATGRPTRMVRETSPSAEGEYQETSNKSWLTESHRRKLHKPCLAEMIVEAECVLNL